jgi:tellurite resistance protein TerC
MSRSRIAVSYAASRRVAVGVVGTSVLLIGVAMIALPGPALVVIPAGLGILALEFAWARRWLRIAREKSEQARELLRTREPEETESSGRGVE